MSDAVTVRTKKFITNRLLQRRQFLVEVIHPGLAGVSKKDLKEKLAKMYKVTDPSCILLYGFKVAFGGGRSTEFEMIYDNLVAAKKFGPSTARGYVPPCCGERRGRCPTSALARLHRAHFRRPPAARALSCASRTITPPATHGRAPRPRAGPRALVGVRALPRSALCLSSRSACLAV